MPMHLQGGRIAMGIRVFRMEDAVLCEQGGGGARKEETENVITFALV